MLKLPVIYIFILPYNKDKVNKRRLVKSLEKFLLTVKSNRQIQLSDSTVRFNRQIQLPNQIRPLLPICITRRTRASKTPRATDKENMKRFQTSAEQNTSMKLFNIKNMEKTKISKTSCLKTKRGRIAFVSLQYLPRSLFRSV